MVIVIDDKQVRLSKHYFEIFQENGVEVLLQYMSLCRFKRRVVNIL